MLLALNGMCGWSCLSDGNGMRGRTHVYYLSTREWSPDQSPRWSPLHAISIESLSCKVYSWEDSLAVDSTTFLATFTRLATTNGHRIRSAVALIEVAVSGWNIGIFSKDIGER